MKILLCVVIACCAVSQPTNEPRKLPSALLDWVQHEVELEIFDSQPTVPHFWTVDDPVYNWLHYTVAVGVDPQGRDGTLLWEVIRDNDRKPDEESEVKLFYTELEARLYVEGVVMRNAVRAYRNGSDRLRRKMRAYLQRMGLDESG